MRAITIHQPWASLITLGEKRYETRTWRTAHRGRVAIHAGWRLPRDVRIVLGMPPFFDVLSRHGIREFGQLARGAIVGVAELVDCVPTETLEQEVDGTVEEQFGDFQPRRCVKPAVAHPPLLARSRPKKCCVAGSRGF
jgi:hypothetical protein